jgi:hypothetical protein
MEGVKPPKLQFGVLSTEIGSLFFGERGKGGGGGGGGCKRVGNLG